MQNCALRNAGKLYEKNAFRKAKELHGKQLCITKYKKKNTENNALRNAKELYGELCLQNGKVYCKL